MAGFGQLIKLTGRFSRTIAATTFSCGLILTLSIASTAAVAATGFAVIHTFTGGSDGEFPEAGLTLDTASGLLHGTTFGSLDGGGPDKHCSKGCGNAYKYNIMNGQLSTQYTFDAGNRGAFPTGEVVIANDGTVYGTTEFGGGTACGGAGCGTAFGLTSSGGKAFYRFCTYFPTCGNGALPHAGPIIGTDKNLYGTTSFGGAASGYKCDNNFGGCGTVFMLTPDFRHETVLYSFCRKRRCRDGAIPFGVLLQDAASGDFYGTTQFGGEHGAGTVFELKPSNGKYTDSVLYSFCQNAGCPDGAIPEAGLIEDVPGNLYGTASAGGGGGCKGSVRGCGVVFKLAQDGTYRVLYTFAGGSDGALPQAPLVLDSETGILYGNTEKGGGGMYCAHPKVGCGTVFMLAADGTESLLHAFGHLAAFNPDGAQPEGALLLYNGYLYGAARVGGLGVSAPDCDCGTLFTINVANRSPTQREQVHGRPPGWIGRPDETKTHPAPRVDASSP